MTHRHEPSDIQAPEATHPGLYWICQIVGWLCLMLFMFHYDLITESDKTRLHTLLMIAVFSIEGVIASHGLRYSLRRLHWLELPLTQLWWRLILLVPLVTTAVVFLLVLPSLLLTALFAPMTWANLLMGLVGTCLMYFMALSGWTALYVMMKQSRRADQLMIEKFRANALAAVCFFRTQAIQIFHSADFRSASISELVFPRRPSPSST